MLLPMRKGLNLSGGEIHANEAPPAYGIKQNGPRQQASPCLNPSSVMIGSEGRSMDISFTQPVGMVSSKSITRAAGYCMPPPAANKLDPLQLSIAPNAAAMNLNLSIAPHMPAINLNLSFAPQVSAVNLNLSLAPHVPAINLNLLPSESRVAPVPYNSMSSMKTTNPSKQPLQNERDLPPLRLRGLSHSHYNGRPVAVERVRGKDPQFGPFILESSEVAKEYTQQQQQLKKAAPPPPPPPPPAVANMPNNKRMMDVEEEAGAGPAAKRRYVWPTKTVAKLNEKIEKLKEEALRKPAERRSLLVIEAEIDKLQATKERIHLRVSGQLLEDGQGSSRSSAPSEN